MGFVTLYSYNPLPTVLRTIIRSDTDPTYISYTDFGSVGSTPQPPVNSIVSVTCFDVDQYTYKVQATIPYAYFSKLPNAPECGYTPPSCDISKVSFITTDQTQPDIDNGTANLFCTSSYEPITYFLGTLSGGIITSNTTGYFTGLSPQNDYYIDAIDMNGCEIQQRFAILPFDTTKTHFKYRLKFTDKDGTTNFELRLYDMLHNYAEIDYPKDILGTGSPVIYKQSDQSEDKTTAIVSSNLTMNLWYTGLDFTPDEFNLAPQQSWLAQLYIGGDILFQGFVIPDENQDSYMDAPYAFTMTATDGLPSLKGNSFGNGSGGNGFGTLQIQQYGLAKWCRLVQQCLNQLGYNYGNVKILSSLRYNNQFDGNLWLNIGTWSDILYDSAGVAVDTYTALTNLLAAMKLCIISYGGSFVLINWNDLSYISNGVSSVEYLRCFYEFAGDFSNIDANGLDVVQPLVQPIGFDFPIQPIKPPQNINYDKPYNIEVDINFNVLALLYENPSFEIGAVQGALPPGWQRHGTLLPTAYCQYDPLNPATGSGAYDGNWVLRTQWNYADPDIGDHQELLNYIDLITPIEIDQTNQKLNLAFQWRPEFFNDVANSIARFTITFHDGTSGIKYYWYTGFLSGHGDPRWIAYTTDLSLNLVNATDENQRHPLWYSYSITTLILPETQLGTVNIRIYVPLYFKTGSYVLPTGTTLTTDIDSFNLTTQDASDALNLQIGEKHLVTAITGVPQANLKNVPLSLFTFPLNKRVAGNVFYGNDYATSTVQNLWNFALKSQDPQDRLAATVTRAIGRNYAFQMHKFEGDVFASVLQYYGVFTIKYLDGIIFAPFSLEGDLRNSEWHVILIQITDQSQQAVYQYVPIYQRSARGNG